MAVLYGLLRALATAMRLVAAARHARAKQRYERLEESFRAIEDDCKAHEVCVGRPVDYNAQLRLLKAFEVRERARVRWVRATGRLEARQRRETAVKNLYGRKLPYTFGLLDMAFAMHLLDRLGFAFGFNLTSLADAVRSWM